MFTSATKRPAFLCYLKPHVSLIIYDASGELSADNKYEADIEGDTAFY